MDRVFNFSAGPSAVPLSVLEKAQSEFCCYPGAGCSVMEMSHRSRSYKEIIDHAESSLREIMAIPDDYAVLFLQGGATAQFSMSAVNLAERGQKAGYTVTGVFAKKCFEEASRWCDAVKVTDGTDCNFAKIPEIKAENLSDDMAFLHITGNNTAAGTMYKTTPEHGNLPLVGDWSSAILGTEINVKDYAVIYAGAQKNMGCAGVTVAIVKRSAVLGEIDPVVPSMMRYAEMDKTGSMLNTPPTYPIYMLGLVCDWVKEQGGVSELQKINTRKADILYGVIDSSKIYTGLAEKDCRSIMNVTFKLPDEEMTSAFVKMAEGRGLISLKGYRYFGGIRASIYNAMPVEGVEKLALCMTDFEKGYRE